MSDCQRISLCRPAAARKQEPWQKVHCNCFVAIRQRWKAKRNQNKCCRLSFKDTQIFLDGSLSSFCRSPIAIFTVAHLSAQLLLGQRNRVPSTRKHQADVVPGSKGLGHSIVLLVENLMESAWWRIKRDSQKPLAWHSKSWQQRIHENCLWWTWIHDSPAGSWKKHRKIWLFGCMYSCLLVLLAAWLKLDGLRPGLHGMMYVPLLKKKHLGSRHR